MTATPTPMMQQYTHIKEAHQGFLLFYRMGDFYELFGEDAEIASATLGITLTARRTSKDSTGIPMCGVPHHAAEGYISTLINAGHKVALCDQTETPEQAKARGGYKALVKRDVVRLFTGGTLTEDALLPTSSHNHLVAVTLHAQKTATLSWVDISTGHVALQDIPLSNLGGELLRLNAAEVLVTEKDSHILENIWPLNKMTLNDALFTGNHTEDILSAYGLKSLSALGLENTEQEVALGALLSYIRLTQVGKLPPLQRPDIHRTGGHVLLDAATRRNLELATTLRGSKKGSLIHSIDHTVTAAGARLLSLWINAPLTDVKKISARHTAVAFMSENASLREDVRTHLKSTADMARAVSRLTLGRGGPRDISAIATTLTTLPTLIQKIESGAGAGGLLSSTLTHLSGLEDLAHQLTSALKSTEDGTLPLLARDGHFIADNYCPKLDAFRTLAHNGNQVLQTLINDEIAATGLQLKLKFNKVWGRFFEVSKGQLAGKELPTHFIHRQTTTQCQRFTTEKLMLLEQDLSAAEANALAREQELFHELATNIQTTASHILTAAEALACIDVIQSGAELAQRRHYVQPTIDNSTTFSISNGRHPVVETTVDSFMPNSTCLTDNALWLITGPNMAGKSTFLRQNALMTVLAQAGYFVPAEEAHIGIVDKIFCRLGASDDLAEGQSTFMVEMVETAHILSHATPKSLVILDEIGRGTATYDGLSIAWAAVEHLVNVCHARGLFATHYHELTTLSDTFTHVSNHHVAVKEWKGDIVFLHEVKEGAAPGSYGIHVAKLAGVPKTVLTRAEDILSTLEKTGNASLSEDMPLFSAPSTPPQEPENTSEVEEKLVNIDLDALSPRDAQNLLYDLKIMAAMGNSR